jgi:hypothetical protein
MTGIRDVLWLMEEFADNYRSAFSADEAKNTKAPRGSARYDENFSKSAILPSAIIYL